MKALCTDYSPSPFQTAPFFSSLSPPLLWSPPCAKNYQYLLNASHKARPRTGRRGCRGLPGGGDQTRGEAIMRCPEPSHRARVSEGSRCSSTSGPRGPHHHHHHHHHTPCPRNFISGPGGRDTQPGPDLLQRGEPGDGRGKSSLLWIVIIGLLTSTASPLSPKVCVCVCVCVCVWVSLSLSVCVCACVWGVCMRSKIIYSSLEYLLFTPPLSCHCCTRVCLLSFNNETCPSPSNFSLSCWPSTLKFQNVCQVV